MKIDQPKIDRFLSLLLIIGGGAGVVVNLLFLAKVRHAPLVLGGLALVMLLVMILTVVVGVGFWRVRPMAYLWAKIIFSLQVPFVTSSAFKYQFFTALMVELSVQLAPEAKLNFEGQLGSTISFAIAPDTSDLIIGVNLLAIAALAYLFLVPRKSMESYDQAELVSPDSQTAE